MYFLYKARHTCKTLECLNGGKCVELNTTSAKCECATGFSGNQCESDIDECTLLEKPCKNNSVCRNRVGSYECICPSGFTGPECNKRNFKIALFLKF